MMNRVKGNSSVDPNSLYTSSYSIDTDLGYTTTNNNNNNNLNLGFTNEFKIETSISGSQSAPTSLITNTEHFSYPHYTPNMDYMQCLQSTDDSVGSSCSSGTKLSYPQTQDHIQASPYMQSSGQSIDSYFSNADILLNTNEVDENENSMKDDLKRGRGRGRVGGNSGVRKRHLNQENNDDERNGSGNDFFSVNGNNNGRGKHGKALARHPFIPSYMDPNNGPHLCVVCRHNASGFHYRVMACEGCKGFFRRTVQNNLAYSCKFNNKCEILPHNRAQCQECRWRKCLDVGMAKDLVLSEEARRAKKELIAANRAKKLTSDKPSQMLCSEFRDMTSPIDHDKPTFTISDNDDKIINQIKHAFDETDVSNTEPIMDFHDPNLNQILQCIVDHHVTSLIIKCDIIDDGNINSAKFNFPQEFNTLSIIVKPILQRVISFAFLLPKFSELSINDQIILLKNACFDIIALRNAINYDKQNQVLTLETNFVVNKDLLKMHKLVEPTYVFVKRISSLNMDYVEISLMAALALLSCDRMGLQDLGKVEGLQDDILRSIDCYMKMKSFDNTHRQSELYATILPELRSTTSWHTQIMINSTTSLITTLLPTIKAIYHYPAMSICSRYIESSDSQFIIPTDSSIYNSDLKYLNFAYNDSHDSTMPPLYSSLDRSHLSTPGSGQSQPLSTYTDLLIDSTACSPFSDMKISRLLITDQFLTQVSSAASSFPNSTSSSSTATRNANNHTPVTTKHNHQTANHDPVYDFTTDLI